MVAVRRDVDVRVRYVDNAHKVRTVDVLESESVKGNYHIVLHRGGEDVKRFCRYVEGKLKRDGDHIFAFSTYNTALALLFNDLSLESYQMRIHTFLHPFLEKLYHFNY